MYKTHFPPFRLLTSVVLLGLVPFSYAQNSLSPVSEYVNSELESKTAEPLVTFTEQQAPTEPRSAIAQTETPSEPENQAVAQQFNTSVESEFNVSFFGDDENAVGDLSRFNHSNYVPAGSYDVDVFVNGELKGRTDVVYIETGANTTALCVSEQLEALFDLQSNAYEDIEGEACNFAEKRIPQAKIRLDQGTLSLKLDIPQALTVVRPRGYISPSLWQDSVPVAFVNYNLSQYNFRQDSSKHQSQHLFLQGGINLFGWALRHTGSMSHTQGVDSDRKYNRGITYLQRGIAALGSELTLGDFTTEGSVTDSLSLRGAALATDIRMLPQTQRGYAPRIQGTAQTNAVVTIRQNGNVIYQTNVPAGQFVINDLYPTGYSGELSVEVTEADGKVQHFTVPYATLVPLLRPGQIKYQLAAGRYRYGNIVLKDYAGTGSLQYGLLNNLSLNAGFIGHKKYRSGTLGMAMNTPIGAFSGDITQARAEFGEGSEKQHRKGFGLRASYNFYFDPTQTNITLATYRYFSRNYYNVDEAVWFNQLDHDPELRDNSRENLDNSLRPKHRYQLSVSQQLSEKWGSFYFSGSAINYWNSNGTNFDYQISYGNHYKMLSYQLGFSQAYSRTDNRKDKQFYVNFSLPLPMISDSNERQGYYSSSTTFKGKNGNTFRQSYSRSLGEYNELSYALASAVENRLGVSVSGSLNYRTNFGNFNAAITKNSDRMLQYNFGASGAIVAHPKGITLSDSVGHTFGIVHAKNGRGARLNNGLGKKLDYFGNAIVEHLTPYEYNRLGIDPTDLPINIEFDATEREVIPKANSAMLVDLNAQRNTMVLFNVSAVAGDIPMGTEAQDDNGNVIGYVVQGGMLFANRLAKESGTISLKWGLSENERCRFDYKLPSLNDENVTDNLHVDAVCR